MALADYFPTIAAALQRSDADMRADVARGDYVGAAGASLRRVATVPLAAFHDTVTRPALTLAGGVGRAAAGLTGVDGVMLASGGEMPPAKELPAAAAKAAAPAAAPAPEASLDELRASALQAVLNNPKGVSLRQLMAVSQAAPAPRKPFSIKDIAGGDALEAARASLAVGIKAAGDNIPEQQKAYLRYQNAASALAGVAMQNEQLAAAIAAARAGE